MAMLPCLRSRRATKGLNAPLVGGDGWDSPTLYQIGGAALDGSYFTDHYSSYDADPRVQKFVADYQKRYGVVPDALGRDRLRRRLDYV
jgi:branched-chain amino acid transport system substrate-binding protein